MRRTAVFLVLLLVLLVFFIPKANASTTESLYVSGFTSVNEQWDETGDSPWLNDSTDNYVSTNVDEEWHEEFTYADGAGVGTLDSVSLYIEVNGPSARNDYVVVDLHDGSDWTEIANIDCDNDGYLWFNFDVSGTLDSWAKVDAAKLKIQYQRSGSPSTETVYVRKSYLYVTYTTASIKNFFGDITAQATANSVSSTSFDANPTVTPTGTIGYSSTTSLDRNPTVNATGTVGSTDAHSFDKEGSASPQATFSSLSTSSFDKNPSLAHTGSINSLKTVEMNKSISLDPTVSIESVVEDISGTLLNFFGEVAAQASIDSYVLKTIIVYGEATAQMTVSAYKTGSVDKFAEVVVQVSADSTKSATVSVLGDASAVATVTSKRALDSLINKFIEASVAALGTKDVTFGIYPTVTPNVSVSKSNAWEFSLQTIIDASASIAGSFESFSGTILNLFGGITGQAQASTVKEHSEGTTYHSGGTNYYWLDNKLTNETKPLKLEGFYGSEKFDYFPGLNGNYKLEVSLVNEANETRETTVTYWLTSQKTGETLFSSKKDVNIPANSVKAVVLSYPVTGEGKYVANFRFIVHHSEAIESSVISMAFEAFFGAKKAVVAVAVIAVLAVFSVLVDREDRKKKTKKA